MQSAVKTNNHVVCIVVVISQKKIYKFNIYNCNNIVTYIKCFFYSKARPVNCYNCDSTIDVRCKDPFNFSALPEDRPAVMLCNGFCVKWVRRARTANEIIRRTCISQFDVNLFMIDKVCMQEKTKMGHMCFCEGEACNNTPKLSLPFAVFVVILVIYCFFTFNVRWRLW